MKPSSLLQQVVRPSSESELTFMFSGERWFPKLKIYNTYKPKSPQLTQLTCYNCSQNGNEDTADGFTYLSFK